MSEKDTHDPITIRVKQGNNIVDLEEFILITVAEQDVVVAINNIDATELAMGLVSLINSAREIVSEDIIETILDIAREGVIDFESHQ